MVSQANFIDFVGGFDTGPHVYPKRLLLHSFLGAWTLAVGVGSGIFSQPLLTWCLGVVHPFL